MYICDCGEKVRCFLTEEAANDIELEQEAVKLGTHIYFDKPGEEAMGIFVDRVISMIRAQKEQQ